MFKISMKQAFKFISETDKYKALTDLCDYLEDTCTKEERLEIIYIRKAIDAALALCCALATEPENAASKLFSDQFECLFEFIKQYCKECYIEAYIEACIEVCSMLK